jgi:hypothetical protein
MKQRPRIYCSAEQKALMWDRWRAGDSLHEIARLHPLGDASGSLAHTRPAQGWIQAADVESGWPFRTGNT